MSRYGTLRPNIDDVDHNTARSICDEVGARLQKDSSFASTALPLRLSPSIVPTATSSS